MNVENLEEEGNSNEILSFLRIFLEIDHIHRNQIPIHPSHQARAEIERKRKAARSTRKINPEAEAEAAIPAKAETIAETRRNKVERMTTIKKKTTMMGLRKWELIMRRNRKKILNKTYKF
jgi:hypothetical protein